ncbi:OmpL47-type beta-barrel domain-containing protein [Paenibacillus montanisoli]|nr:5'-nucleotidase C-terminal domain-containing protein [Paenibacillus montanisoli]
MNLFDQDSISESVSGSWYKERSDVILRIVLIIAFTLLMMNVNATSAMAAGEPTGQVTILHDTHIHGRYYMPNTPAENMANLFGVARKIEKDKPNALYLANGDDIATSVISDVFQGKHIIDAFNASPVDYDTFGNHDFDYGSNVLRQRVSESNFTWLTANIYDRRTNDIFAKETGKVQKYVIKEVNGIKVGITGLGIKGSFMDLTEIEIKDPVTVMKALIPEMKQAGADIIVVTSHLGNKQARLLASQVDGIAVLVGDHSESILDTPEVVNKTILSFRGCEFEFLGELTLQVSNGKVTSYQYVRHSVAEEAAQPGFAPDPGVKTVTDRYIAQLTSTIIGSNSNALETRSSIIRKKETGIGNYVTDVMRAWRNSDVALYYSGAIATNKVYNPGNISQKMVLDLLPQTLEIVELRVTGKQLLSTLENGVSKVENSDVRFPQVSGISFSYDSAKPLGQRIVKATIKGVPIDPTATYTVATADYMASGAMGYADLANAVFVTNPETGPLITTLVMNQIAQDHVISPELEGRIIANDFVAPETRLKLQDSTPAMPNGLNGWYTQDIAFTLVASDSLSGVAKTEYRINGGKWFQVLNDAAVTLSTDGKYIIDYRSWDVAGNVESVKTVSYYVDKTAPVTIATINPESNEGSYAADVTFSLTASDAASVMKTEYRINDGAWMVYGDPLVFTEDGAYTIEYRSTDEAGNEEIMQTESFTIAKAIPDTAAPVTTANLNPGSPDVNSGWYRSDVQITFTAADDQSGVAQTEYRVNSASWIPYTGVLSISTNGLHTIEYRSKDIVGNVEIVQSISLKVDKTAPVTTIALDPALTGGTYPTDVTVSLAASDITSGIAMTEYRINSGVWSDYSAPMLFTEDGAYTIEYRSTDAAGNAESIKTVHFFISKSQLDNTAPNTTVSLHPVTPDGGSGWYRSDVSVLFSGTDDMSGIAVTEYSINGGSWFAYHGALTIPSDGTYIMEYRSKDIAGNVESIQSVNFKVDKTAPETTISMDPVPSGGAYLNDVTVSLAASDAASGIAKTEYRINEGTWTDYSNPLLFTEHGAYTIEYRSTDAAGNEEFLKTVSFSIASPAQDVTAPSTSVALQPGTPDGSSGWYRSDVGITLSATDDQSGVAQTEYRINNGSWVPYNGTLTVSTDDTYTIEYRSTDAAGNEESAKSVNFKVDKRAPETTISMDPVPSGGVYLTNVTIGLASSDAASGISKIEYRIGDGAWMDYSNPLFFTENAAYTIEYRSTDAAGNVESVKTVSFSIAKPVPDYTAPVTTIVLNPVTPGGSNGWYVSNVSITYSATDDLSGVSQTEYSINGLNWVPYSGGLTITSDGMYTIEYRSRDIAGNVESSKKVSFKLDKTAPATIIVTTPSQPGGKDGWYTSNVTVSFSASNDVSGVARTEYRTNGGSWTLVTNGTLSISSDGIIEYRSIDNAGNVETPKSIKIDKTAPSSTYKFNKPVNGLNGWYTIKVYIYLYLKDNLYGSGVTQLEYRINGGNWVAYNADDAVPLTADGVFNVEYRSIDAAGNVQQVSIGNVYVDRTAPISTAASPTAPSGGKNLVISVNEAVSGVAKTEYRVNGGAWIAYTGAVNFNVQGSYLVEYRSTDNAGNVEVAKTITIPIN